MSNRDTETSELLIWLKTFSVFMSAIISAVAFFLYINRYIIFNRAAGTNAGLSFTAESIQTEHAGNFKTQLMITTDNAQIHGTDVRIKFDRSKLELISVLPSALNSTTLKTFMPVAGTEFDMERVVTQANETGFVEFGAVTADLASNTVTAPFRGTAILAELTFRSIQPGETKLTILNTHPSHDSTIVSDIMPPLNILTDVRETKITSRGIYPTALPQKGK